MDNEDSPFEAIKWVLPIAILWCSLVVWSVRKLMSMLVYDLNKKEDATVVVDEESSFSSKSPPPKYFKQEPSSQPDPRDWSKVPRSDPEAARPQDRKLGTSYR